MRTHDLPALLLPALLAGPALAAPAGDLSVFVGPATGPGDVVIADELGGLPLELPAGLDDLTLLPIEVAGRALLHELDPAHPRRLADVPGASRIELPLGQGSLYRFRRKESAGAATFGFFVVPADGRARLVFEVPGTGPAGDTDPFAGRVAIAPGGDAMLVATTVAAGGDLHEVDLALGTAQDRTGSHGPLAFQDGGLELLAGFGVGVAASGVVRFERLPGASASDVVFPGPAPAHFGDGLAASGDSQTVALIAGATVQAADVWVLGATGPPTVVTPAPAWIPSAGYLPEHQDGPFLALSQDGSRCAWRTEELLTTGETSREAWLRATGPQPPAPVQISADAFFMDTLDEAGLFAFLVTGDLLFGIGERADAAGGMESTDLHRAALDQAGNVTLVNATLSSGDATVPFLSKPTIDPAHVVRFPGTDRFLLFDEKNELLQLVDGAAATATTLLDQVKSLDLHEPTGGGCLVSLLRADPLDRREVHRLTSQGALTTLLTLPSIAEIERPATPGGGTVAFVVRAGPNEWLVRASLPTGAISVLLPFPVPYGPALVATPAGGIGFSVGAAGNPAVHLSWQANGGLGLASIPVFPGFLLPGA